MTTKEVLGMNIQAIHITCVGAVAVDLSLDECGIDILNFQVTLCGGKVEVSIPQNYDRSTCRDCPTISLSDSRWVDIRSFIEGRVSGCKWLMELLSRNWDASIFEVR